MSFKTKRSLDVYGKASYLLLAVSVCAMINQSDSANASLKSGVKTGAPSTVARTTTNSTQGVGSRGLNPALQQSQLGASGGSSLPNQSSTTSKLNGGNKSSISTINQQAISSQTGQGVGVDPLSGLPMGKISHKYGTDANNFQVIDANGPLDPTKRYVQFVNTKGQLKTYEESLSTKMKLLWSASEVGTDRYIGSDGKVHRYIYRSKPNWVSGADIEKVQSQKQSGGSVYEDIYLDQNTGKGGSGDKNYKSVLNIDLGSDDDILNNKTYVSSLNVDQNKDVEIKGDDKDDGTKIYTSSLSVGLKGKGQTEGEGSKTHKSTLKISLGEKDNGRDNIEDKTEVAKISIFTLLDNIGESDKVNSQDIRTGEEPKTYTSTLRINLSGKDEGTDGTVTKRKVNKIFISTSNDKTGEKGNGKIQGEEQSTDVGIDSSKKVTESSQDGEGKEPKIYTSILKVSLGEKEEKSNQTGGKREVSKINTSTSQGKTEEKVSSKDGEMKLQTGALDIDSSKKVMESSQDGEGKEPEIYTSTLRVNLGGKDKEEDKIEEKREVVKVTTGTVNKNIGEIDKESSQGKGQSTDVDIDLSKKEMEFSEDREREKSKIYTSTLRVNLGGKDKEEDKIEEKREVTKITTSTVDENTRETGKESGQASEKGDNTEYYTADLDVDASKKGTGAGQAEGEGSKEPKDSFLSELQFKLSQSGTNVSQPKKSPINVQKLSINSEDINKAKDSLKPLPSKGDLGTKDDKKGDSSKYIVRGKDTGLPTGARRHMIDVKKEVTIDKSVIVNTTNTSGKVQVLSKYFEEKAKEDPKPVVSNLDGSMHFDLGIDGDKVKIQKANITLTDKEGERKGLDIDPIFVKNLSKGLSEGYGAKVEEAKRNNPLTTEPKAQVSPTKPIQAKDGAEEKVKVLTNKVTEIKNSGDLEKTEKARALLQGLRDKMNVQ